MLAPYVCAIYVCTVKTVTKMQPQHRLSGICVLSPEEGNLASCALKLVQQKVDPGLHPSEGVFSWGSHEVRDLE